MSPEREALHPPCPAVQCSATLHGKFLLMLRWNCLCFSSAPFPVPGPSCRFWHHPLTPALEIFLCTAEISPLSVSSSREDHVLAVWEVSGWGGHVSGAACGGPWPFVPQGRVSCPGWDSSSVLSHLRLPLQQFEAADKHSTQSSWEL